MITSVSSLIDVILAFLLIVPLQLHILEDFSAHVIRVFDSKDSMSPTVSHLPVSFPSKVVLVFEFLVALHFLLDCLSLLSLFLWTPKYSVIFKQHSLKSTKVFVNLSYLVSLNIVQVFLTSISLLHGLQSVSFYQTWWSIILINVYPWLSFVLSINRCERPRWSDLINVIESWWGKLILSLSVNNPRRRALLAKLGTLNELIHMNRIESQTRKSQIGSIFKDTLGLSHACSQCCLLVQTLWCKVSIHQNRLLGLQLWIKVVSHLCITTFWWI